MRRKIPELPLSGRGHVWTARPGKNFLTDDIGRARWSLKCGRVLDQGSRRATRLLRLPRGGKAEGLATTTLRTPSANEGKRVYQCRWLDQVDFKTSTPAGF